MYFSLVPPRSAETPVIVEVPHAGIEMDPESLAQCVAPARCIGQDADLLVSELFDAAPDCGAHLLYSHLSRYVCDLNRAEGEVDAQTAVDGKAANAPHGVVWRRTTDGRPAIGAPLAPSEIERRLDLIYRPYHAALYQLVQDKLARFGFVILLCGHSMPSFGRLGERRADVVPGSRGRSTAGSAVLKTCDRVALAAGYDVAHDSPYRGGYTTGRYGSPASGVHALQIELARRLYMEEANLERHQARFEACKAFCTSITMALGGLDLRS